MASKPIRSDQSAQDYILTNTGDVDNLVPFLAAKGITYDEFNNYSSFEMEETNSEYVKWLKDKNISHTTNGREASIPVIDSGEDSPTVIVPSDGDFNIDFNVDFY